MPATSTGRTTPASTSSTATAASTASGRRPATAKPNHVGVFSTPAIGDVNGDGDLEVAYGSFNQKIYLKDRNGADMPGWPRENYDTIWSSPALADTDADGKKEIIVGTDLGGGAAVWTCAKGIRGTMSVFNYKGEFKKNFPRCIDTPIWSSPAVWDVTGDHVFDIVVGTNNYLEFGKQVGVEKTVRAWNSRTGSLIWDTNLGSGNRIFSSPAIGDVGGDGKLEVAIGAIDPANYGEMWLLDAKTGAIRWHREGGHRAVCACQFMGSPVDRGRQRRRQARCRRRVRGRRPQRVGPRRQRRDPRPARAAPSGQEGLAVRELHVLQLAGRHRPGRRRRQRDRPRVGDLGIEPAARQGVDRRHARTWQRPVADVQAAGETELVQVMLAP